MKTELLSKSAILIAVIVILSFLESSFAGGKKITIVTEEWPPFNYMENGVLKGISVDITKRIIFEIDADAEIILYPSMRASFLLNTEKRVMLITMMRTPEREKKYRWIGPLGSGSIYFYKKSGNPLKIKSIEDAKKVPIIATRHAGLVLRILKKANFKNLDSTSTSGIFIYKKLLIGRCDLAISESDHGVKYILKKINAPSNSLVRTPVKIVESKLFIACSKDIPETEIKIWQNGLDKIKKSGVYHKILKEYE